MADAARVRSVAAGFGNFIFGGMVPVIEFLVMRLGGFLGGKRRARKSQQHQNSRKKLLHGLNPTIDRAAKHRTPVTVVPSKQPDNCSEAAGVKTLHLIAQLRGPFRLAERKGAG